MFEAIGYERDRFPISFPRPQAGQGRESETALVLVLGDLSQGVPLVRVHSQCLTGEVLLRFMRSFS
jgi:GTP cyclohydrolase II